MQPPGPLLVVSKGTYRPTRACRLPSHANKTAEASCCAAKAIQPPKMCGCCGKSLVLWCKGCAHTRDMRVVQEEFGCRAVLGMLMRPDEALRQDRAIQL